MSGSDGEAGAANRTSEDREGEATTAPHATEQHLDDRDECADDVRETGHTMIDKEGEPSIPPEGSGPVSDDDLQAHDQASLDFQSTDSSPSSEQWTEIKSGLDQLLREIDRLKGQLSTELNALRVKDDTMSRLHRDLQQARNGLDLKMLRPLLTALVRLHDNMVRDVRRKSAEGNPEARDHTAVHLEELLIALEDNGVTAMVPPGESVSEIFDGSRQSIVRTVETDREELHGAVAEALTCGFNYDGAPFQKQKVTVFKHRAQSPEATGHAQLESPVDIERDGID